MALFIFQISFVQITILSSSTRLNRQSHRVALALKQYIEQEGLHNADVIDLAAYHFPIMEEVLSRHPSPPDGLSDFAQRVHQADAILFVSPEYNGSYTAALKNAVDYLKENEFSKKVVGVVSVTTGALGGIRGAMAMQQLVLGIGGFTIPQMLTVGHVAQRFDEGGNLIDPSYDKTIRTFLGHFQWLAEAVVEKKMATLV